MAIVSTEEAFGIGDGGQQSLGERQQQPAGASVQYPRTQQHGFQGGLSGNILDRVRTVESSNRLDAVGPKVTTAAGTEQARGPYQILPSTADYFGIKDPQALHDERVARPLAETILSRYSNQFAGDVEKGVAAYNAGPGRVRQAVRQGGDNWKQYLPKQTQGYLQRTAAASTLEQGIQAADEVAPDASLQDYAIRPDTTTGQTQQADTQSPPAPEQAATAGVVSTQEAFGDDLKPDPGFLERAGGAFVEDFTRQFTSLGEAAGIAQGAVQDKDPRETTAFDLSNAAQDYVERAVGPDERGFWTNVAGGLGSFGAFILGGLAGSGLKLGTKAAQYAIPAFMGSAANSSAQFEQALEQDASLSEAMEASGYGALVGTSEVVPITRALDRLDRGTGGKIKRTLLEGIKGGSEEAAQETFQSVMDNLIASDLVEYDPERGTFQGVGEASGVGFTVGGLANTVLGLVGGRKFRQAREQMEDAQAGEEQAAPTSAQAARDDDTEAPQTPQEGAQPQGQGVSIEDITQSLEARAKAAGRAPAGRQVDVGGKVQSGAQTVMGVGTPQQGEAQSTEPQQPNAIAEFLQQVKAEVQTPRAPQLDVQQAAPSEVPTAGQRSTIDAKSIPVPERVNIAAQQDAATAEQQGDRTQLPDLPAEGTAETAPDMNVQTPTQPRRRARSRKGERTTPQPITNEIRAMGGLKDPKGEIRRGLGIRPRDRPGLINTRRPRHQGDPAVGVAPDVAAQELAVRGFFPGKDTNTVDTDDLYEALDEEINRGRSPAPSAGDIVPGATTAAANRESLEDAADRYGIPDERVRQMDDTSLERAVQYEQAVQTDARDESVPWREVDARVDLIDAAAADTLEAEQEAVDALDQPGDIRELLAEVDRQVGPLRQGVARQAQAQPAAAPAVADDTGAQEARGRGPIPVGDTGQADRGPEAGGQVAPPRAGRGGQGEAEAAGSRQQPVEAEREPAEQPTPEIQQTERTDQGEQRVVPGAEQVSQREQAERGQQGAKKPEAPQQAADEGLFDVQGRGQQDLVDRAKEAPKQGAQATQPTPTKQPPPFKRGERVRTTSFYADTPVGREGKVTKAWTVQKGPSAGQQYARVSFGKNEGGQTISNVYPTNVLERADDGPQYAAAPKPAQDVTRTEAFQRWFGDSKVVDENEGTYDPSTADIRYGSGTTPETRGRVVEPAIRYAIHDELSRIAPGARVRTQRHINADDPRAAYASGIPEGGQPAAEYYEGVIRMALDTFASPGEARGYAGHEGIHFLRDMGLFTPQEWAVLERESKRRWIGENNLPNRPDDPRIVEEGIAYAFQRWRPGQSQESGAIQRLFRKIQEALLRVANRLRGMGYQTVEDVFGRVQSGQVGSREGMDGGWVGPRYASSQATLMDTDVVTPSATLGDVLRNSNRPVMDRLRRGSSKEVLQTTFDGARRVLQDRMLPWYRTQRAIERRIGRPLKESEQVYRAEELYSGRAGEKLFRLNKQHKEPLIEAADRFTKQAGMDPESAVGIVDDFLTAKHAPERNAQIARINPDFEPGSGSGMTDAEAAEVIREAEQNGWRDQLEGIHDRVQAMLQEQLQERVDSGLISQETAEQWRRTYKNWVPLRGLPDDTDENADEGDVQEQEGLRPRQGKGYDVRGPESKRATGRVSRAPDVLAQTLGVSEEAILRGEKNRVLQAVHNLATKHPDERVWEVNPVRMVSVINDEGLVEKRPAAAPQTQAEQERTIKYKLNGEQHRILIHDDRLVRPMKNLDSDDMGALTQTLGRLNRFLSHVNTGWNPEFVISNAFRDVTEASVNLQQYEIDGITRDAIKNYRKALRGAWRGVREYDSNDPWAKWFREFAESGARVSFFRIDDLNEQRGQLVRELKLLDGTKPQQAKKAFRDLFRWVDDANTAVDNTIRLSAYVAARERGVSKPVAASMAKNLTVNFNKRGEIGPQMNALYLFYNASIQGTAVMLNATRSKRVRKIVGGIVATGFAMEMLNAMLSPEDDDGELVYDKINRWTKSRHLIVQSPWGDDRLEIPLPYGYNTFFDLGRNIAAYMRGAPDHGALQASGNVLATAADSFNPIGGTDDIANFLSPTITDPIVDITQNENWIGDPIMPERLPYGPQGPQSQRYFSTVSPAAKEVTTFLNDITGGNKYRPGVIDFSPEVLDYMFKQFGGAAYAFAERTSQFPVRFEKYMTGQSDALTWNEIPFARQLLGEKGVWVDRSAAYDRFAEVEQLKYEVDGLIESGRYEAAREKRRHYRNRLALQDYASNLRDALGKLRDRRNYIEDTYEGETERRYLRQLEQREERMLNRWNRTFLQALEADAAD